MHDIKPDVVLHLAAEVGGIGANRDNPGRFFFANAAMGIHLIEQARKSGAEKVRPGRHDLRLSEIHSRPVSRKRTSGTAIPKKPTRPTASPKRRCWSCARPIASSTGSTPSTCSR